MAKPGPNPASALYRHRGRYRLETFHDPALGRLAACRTTPGTGEGVILLNSAAGPTELETYFKGGSGSRTSLQKKAVLARLADQGWPWEKIAALTGSKTGTRRFLILHEISHLNHGDHKTYGKMDEESRIAVETRACAEALTAMAKTMAMASAKATAVKKRQRPGQTEEKREALRFRAASL